MTSTAYGNANVLVTSAVLGENSPGTTTSASHGLMHLEDPSADSWKVPRSHGEAVESSTGMLANSNTILYSPSVTPRLPSPEPPLSNLDVSAQTPQTHRTPL